MVALSKEMFLREDVDRYIMMALLTVVVNRHLHVQNLRINIDNKHPEPLVVYEDRLTLDLFV